MIECIKLFSSPFILTIITITIQTLLAFCISRKIEKYKIALKKTEIRYGRYNELQINVLRKIYHQLYAFKLSNNLIFNSETNSLNHVMFKNRINEWIKVYFDLTTEFSREKILLPEELKDLFSNTIMDFEKVKKILINQKNHLEYLEMEHQENWNSMYQFEEEELEIISVKIKALKDELYVVKTENNIDKLRKNIEENFRKLNI